MKKQLSVHFLFFTAFFLLVTLFRIQPGSDFNSIISDPLNSIAPSLLVFWVGGIVGTMLPDVDHLIYVYFMRPHEVTSQRVSNLVSQKKYSQSIDLLTKTDGERTNLVFHNVTFQLIFVAFTYFVVSSVGSYFGLGLVLAFSLHLLVDQASDLAEKRTIDHWFEGFPVSLTAAQQKWYVVANIVILLLLGLFL